MSGLLRSREVLKHFCWFENFFDLNRQFQFHVASAAAFANFFIKGSGQVFKRLGDRLMNDAALGADGEIAERSGTG